MRIRSLVDNDLVLPVAVVTDPISWFAEVDNAMMDANGPVYPVGWQFQGRDGKWMCEDNSMELKRLHWITSWQHSCPMH
jgi:hypothetical protein